MLLFEHLNKICNKRSISMNKKIIVLIIILIILLAIFYFRPLEVKELINPLSSRNLPLKVESVIFFSAHSKKELSVTNEESLEELIRLIENIKVKKKIITLGSFSPQFKETYWFTLYGQQNSKYQYIDILSSKYIRINNRDYKIVGNPNLSRIYDIIILDQLDQSEETLDEFYYDLLDNN